MFDIRYILIIILLGIIIYLIYNLYSYQSSKVDKLKENINEKIDLEFEDINERLDELQELIEKRLNDSNKKIRDLYSLQNKMNEVNKMNNQSILNQINQYDEGIEDLGENRDQIFNSVENSSVNKETHKNNNCFIKISQLKHDSKENFYMSPDNKDKNTSEFGNENSNGKNKTLLRKSKSSNSSNSSNSNSNSSKSSNLSKTSKSSKITTSENSENSENSDNSNNSDEISSSKASESYNEKNLNTVNQNDNMMYKNNLKLNKESDNSIILEINDNFIKMPFGVENSPKVNNAYKSINEFSNLIKNNSTSKFNSDEMNRSKLSDDLEKKNFKDKNINNMRNDYTNEDLTSDNESENISENISDYNLENKSEENLDEIFISNDPPLLHPEIINKMNFLNKSRKSNKIIDITT
jgi:tetrahydromethanopterin S-methyltransferase subunit B